MKVTVYTSGPACMACRMTKRHLAKLGIPFDEEPIDDLVLDAATFLELRQAPVVCASTALGDEYWDGYRPDRLDGLVA